MLVYHNVCVFKHIFIRYRFKHHWLVKVNHTPKAAINWNWAMLQPPFVSSQFPPSATPAPWSDLRHSLNDKANEKYDLYGLYVCKHLCVREHQKRGQEHISDYQISEPSRIPITTPKQPEKRFICSPAGNSLVFLIRSTSICIRSVLCASLFSF